MKKTIKVLYKGKIADVRDYEVRKCLDKKENMIIKFKDEVMTLTSLELQTKLLRTSKYKFKSKVGGKDYFLYSYLWNPDNTMKKVKFVPCNEGQQVMSFQRTNKKATYIDLNLQTEKHLTPKKKR